MRSSSTRHRRTRAAAGLDRAIVCAACGAAVGLDEAVATRADAVVHARCHPTVIAVDRERAAAR